MAKRNNQDVSNYAMSFFFLSEVLKMPFPKWLIENFLTLKSMALMYGCPGVGKTFIAIDIALSVAMGLDWFGNKTSSGSVVMVSTEGNLGLQLRLRGWEFEKKIPLEGTKNLLVCFESIDFSKESAQQTFLQKINELPEPPKLIIVDTFADCFAQSSGNENDSGSVGKFLGGIKRITEQIGAAALIIIHHTKKGDRAERGSTALRAVMDSMYLVRTTKSGSYKITTTKQRNFAASEGITYVLKEVTLPNPIEKFVLSATCVPEKIDADTPLMLRFACKISENQRTVLALLSKDGGLRQSEIREKTGLARSSLSETLKKLTDNGLVKPNDGLYLLTEDGNKFTGEFGSGDKENPPEPNENTLVDSSFATTEPEQHSESDEEEYEPYDGDPRYQDPRFRFDYDPNDFDEPEKPEDDDELF